MPTLLTQAPEISVPPSPPRKRWTREQCAALEATGLLERERLELVDGELINKMGKNRPHAISLALLWEWLVEAFGKQVVNSETTVDVSPEDNPTSEPQPDLIVLKRLMRTFPSNPNPKDLHLVVEIPDSSLKFDLSAKAALYARAEIVEYWVLDIEGRRLFCHRDPAHGRYNSVVIYQEHESLSPLNAPAAMFSPALAL